MSLDDLITLLLILLFVGAPLYQRIFGRGSQPENRDPRQGGGPPDPRERGDAEPRGANAGGETRTGPARTADDPPRTAEATDGTSELERRIAEARRRVERARQDASAQRTPPAAEGRYAPTRPATQLVRPREAPTALLGREGTVLERPPAPGAFLGREGVSQPRKKAPPLEVSKRRRRVGGSTLTKARKVFSLAPHDILQGVVWHQILSEPVSARTSRRKPLRVR